VKHAVRSETSRLTFNAISLKNAVLCADCDVVSDSPHDYCLVCGSRSLFNISRLLRIMPKQRAKLVELETLRPTAAQALTFPKPDRVRVRHQQRLTSELQLGLYAKA
jgi:hypothetical protein